VAESALLTNETLTPGVTVLVVGLAAGVVAQGGYYPAGRILLTALVALALLLALRARGWSRSDLPVPVTAAALAAWTLVRGDLLVAAGAVATLGCLVAALVVMRRTGPAERERCAEAAVGVGVLVAVTAWIGVAWRLPRFAVPVEGRLWRGGSTITYPNAAAALLVPLALLAIALLIARPRSATRLAAAYLLLVGVGAALSRAGFIALAVGMIVLMVHSGLRATLRVAAPLFLGAGIAIGALAPSVPAAAQPRPVLAVAGLLAGAVVAIGTALLPGRVRVAALAATVLLTGVVAATQVRSGYLGAILASRGNLDSSGRTRGAAAAFELVAHHPLMGTGVGRAAFLWTTPDGNGTIARYAHNEYLQTLVDLGAIGLALLAGLLAAVVVAVRRGHAHPGRPGVRAGAIAALAALAVHSGFDFLWHIAVIPLAGALLIGLAGPAIREEQTIQRGKVRQ
jgi:hypothetical protein